MFAPPDPSSTSLELPTPPTPPRSESLTATLASAGVPRLPSLAQRHTVWAPSASGTTTSGTTTSGTTSSAPTDTAVPPINPLPVIAPLDTLATVITSPDSPMLSDSFAPTLPMTQAGVPTLPVTAARAPDAPAAAAQAPEIDTPALPVPPGAGPALPGVAMFRVDLDMSGEAALGDVHRLEALTDIDAGASVLDEATSPDEQLPDPPAPLLATSWLGKLVLIAGFLAMPGLFVGDFVGLGLAASTWLALVIWSTMVVANARRSRPATMHARPPRPMFAALSWFVAPGLAGAGLYGLTFLMDWVDAASFDEQGSRNLALAAVVFAILAAVSFALYRPYAILARTTSWVSGDGSKMRKWFAAPFVAVLLSLVIQVLAGLYLVVDAGNKGSEQTASIGAVALILVSLGLPWLAWLITGRRAINAIESGIAHTHARAVRASREPVEISANLSANLAAYMHGAAGEPEPAR